MYINYAGQTKYCLGNLVIVLVLLLLFYVIYSFVRFSS